MDHNKHRKSELAVRFCGCGSVHVTIGKISLHLDKPEFETFAQKVGKAKRLLEEIELTQSTQVEAAILH